MTTLEAPEDSKEIACLETIEKHAESPKIFTTQPKSGKRKPNKNSQSKDNVFGITGSMLSSIVQELGLEGLVDGELVHLSFDCPKTLRKAFKHATRAQKTNICDELQKYMATYVLTYQTKKHALGNTLSKLLPVDFHVGSVELHQYCQSRPRRWINHGSGVVEAEVSEVEVDGSQEVESERLKCGYRDCLHEAVAKAVLKGNGREYDLCREHFHEAESNRCLWRFQK